MHAGTHAPRLERGGDAPGIVVELGPLDPVGGPGAVPAAEPTKVMVPRTLGGGFETRETTEVITTSDSGPCRAVRGYSRVAPQVSQ